MLPEKYVWLTWASAFLVPWIALRLFYRRLGHLMTLASVLTMPFGLTEPIFVPRYWNPPSLFDLARRTGFDVESLIFCFALGGVGVVLYVALMRQALAPIQLADRHAHRHRYHRVALLTPVIAFPALYLFGWNPIYPAILAMLLGGAATVACRPDLMQNTLAGGALFASYYALFMLLLEWSAPGYINQVWNLADLSGLFVMGIPVEELLFGFAFGIYWSGIYEHLAWRRVAPAAVARPHHA
jgi:hypothetical protein